MTELKDVLTPPNDPGSPDDVPIAAAWAYGAGVVLDKRLDNELRDAGIPDRPKLLDIGLVAIEPGAFPNDSPRFRPKLLEVDPMGGCDVGVIGPCTLALGGDGPAGWLFVLGTEAVMAVGFLAWRVCGCCSEGCGGCCVALL